MMNYKIFLHSLILVYFGIATSLLHLQQQASAMVAKNRIKLIVILEPEVPPLGAASLYLPPEEFVANNSLRAKLRNARLLAKLQEQRSDYQVSKLQFNSSATSMKVPQNKLKGNFKRVDLQHNITWQQSLIRQMIVSKIEKSLETIWISFWNKFYFNGFREISEASGQDVFTLYDQINIGIPVKSNPNK
ncbi:hypothetical protein IQ230_21155 [Gloeocapsopsis crepidinum LEGE 06123]|uniref:DUF1400 domain-containing protein n=1 Tax=Gloeocapsopsis crepidinum LEGE 06123 TaxID=588587 RepID=A0ABR9UXU6_9CHRO|nr:hypothetical protein [Gloeocapsopsis crepidinum]MBE9192815.1 hypothetical protein [Gloeocapsopsis crepidinum LEGE 06123]